MANRHHLEIRDTGYMEVAADASHTRVLVFIHGIFGDSSDSWGDLPHKLLTCQPFALFDLASFGYTSKILEFTEPSTTVEQLISFIVVKLSVYDELFFVAHSMGGLLLRQALAQMLTREDQRKIAARVRQCFMIASPITGSWAARALARVRGLTRINKRLAFLAFANDGTASLSTSFDQAAAAAIRAGVPRANIPQFAWIFGAEDRLVARVEADALGKYDLRPIVVPGTHGGIKQNLSVDSVAVSLIVQGVQQIERGSAAVQTDKIAGVKEVTKKREEAVVRAHGRRASTAGRTGRPVIIISCSAHKTDVIGGTYGTSMSIVGQLVDERVARAVVDMRSRLFRQIKQGCMDGVEFKEGNRIMRRANQELRFGPEFGGASEDPCYLPAFKRYTGRAFQASANEWETCLQRVDAPFSF